MTECLLLIDGEHLEAESFRHLSLANAKQLVWGPVSLFGVVLHLAAQTPADLSSAVERLSAVDGAKSATVVAMRRA